MDHGSVPSFVERPDARYNQTIREASTSRLLADPIEFAQNMARLIEVGTLEEVLIQDTSRQVEDIREEFELLIDTAIRRKDLAAVEELFAVFNGFVTSAFHDAREYGVALGAVMEQFRVGLTGVVDLRNRGLTFGDVQSLEDLGRLRRKHNLPHRGGDRETDDAASREDAA